METEMVVGARFENGHKLKSKNNVYKRLENQMNLIEKILPVRTLGRFRPTLLAFLFLLFSQSAAGQEQAPQIEKSIRSAAAIVTAEVEKLTAAWVSDEHGKHIYTTVELHLFECVKGQAPARFEITVVGGTVGEITESVFPSYTFTENERCMLFLQEGCREIIGTGLGKLNLVQEHVLFENKLVPTEAFVKAVAALARDPQSPATLRSVLQQYINLNDRSTEKIERKLTLPDSNPIILSITPPQASAGTSTLVTIQGKNFLDRQDSGNVIFFQRDGASVLNAQITAWSDTQIACIVPRFASSGPVVVTTGKGMSSNSYTYRIAFGFSGGLWLGQSPVIPYLVNTNYSDTAGFLASVLKAAALWNNTQSGCKLEFVGSHSNTVPSQNFRNEILWGQTPPEAIGITYVWSKQSSIMEADMVLRPDFPWGISGTPDGSKFDVETITLHEFGHFFILSDLYGDVGDGNNDSSKVMYGFGNAARVKRSLSTADREGMLWVYPAPGSQILSPIISPAGGNLQSTKVTIVCSAPKVEIRYSLDGTEPTVNSAEYFEPIKLNGSGAMTVKAKAFRDGWIASPTTSAQFTIAPPSKQPLFAAKLRDTTITQNQLLKFTYSVADSLKSLMEYSLLSPPLGAVMSKTGVLTWTPTYRQAGSFLMTVVVTNGIWVDTARSTITVTKVNIKPAMTVRSPATLTQVLIKQKVDFAACATDPNGDQLTYSWYVNKVAEKSGPDTSFTRTFIGAVGSVQNVVCVFSDPEGLKDSTQWNFTLGIDSALAPPASWAYQAKTGKNCIIWLFTTVNPKIDILPFRIGDAVGAFFGRNDSVICAGYTIWQGLNTAITVWGDDDQTQMKDGFAEGEVMTFRIWDSRAGKEHRTKALLGPGEAKFYTDTTFGFITLVAIENLKPTFIVKLTNMTLQQNQMLTLQFTASDPDNDPLRYSLVNPPAGASITSAGLFTWTPSTSQLGTYSIVAVVSDGLLTDTARATVTVAKADTGLPPPSSWAYRSSTGKNCVIGMNTEINPKIGSQPFQSGDAVGVFFKRNDSLICAGYTVWHEQNTAITVWGDDNQTTMKDGFAEGEKMTFKVWHSRAGNEFLATAEFHQGPTVYATNGIFDFHSLVAPTTVLVDDEVLTVPEKFSLYQNYPNPFNPSTRIQFSLPRESQVTLKIFDLLGKEIVNLISQELGAGYYSIEWKATVPSGIYICYLQAGAYIETKKMVLLR
jgi:hypothetical protein